MALILKCSRLPATADRRGIAVAWSLWMANIEVQRITSHCGQKGDCSGLELYGWLILKCSESPATADRRGLQWLGD